jgi:hypothetical protein
MQKEKKSPLLPPLAAIKTSRGSRPENNSKKQDANHRILIKMSN